MFVACKRLSLGFSFFLVLAIGCGQTQPRYQAMTAKELAFFISENLMPGQGLVPEAAFQMALREISENKFTQARMTLDATKLIERSSGECKTALEALYGKLGGKSNPPAKLVDAARSQMEVLSIACSLYKSNVGIFPASLDDLCRKPEGMTQKQWRGPYLDGTDVPLDPWGMAYRLGSKQQDIVEILSSGPDRRSETADDIAVAKDPYEK